MRAPRTHEPFRGQGVMRFEVPDDLLPVDHRARLLWQVVETLDLSAFTQDAKAVEGHEGRPLTSVRMLLVLWLYGISVNIGSAREIARKTRSDAGFQWIVGDCSVCHDKLSEFRRANGKALDHLFTDVLGVLLQRKLVSLDLVAQDGTRMRARATSPSFRGEAALEECREQAALHVKAVLAEAGDPESTAGEKRARLLAAKNYERRVGEALGAIQQQLEARSEDGRDRRKKPPTASTTDAEARIMKMPNGGFGPGYNVQLATAGSPMGGPRTIVGVLVTNRGDDLGSVTPMLDDIERRTGSLPKTLLGDAGLAKHACIRNCASRGVEAIIAIPKRSQNPGREADHHPAVDAWRARMATAEAKETFRARASLCELSNAHLKRRGGGDKLLVRGLGKVTCVALLCALAANLLAHLPNLLA